MGLLLLITIMFYSILLNAHTQQEDLHSIFFDRVFEAHKRLLNTSRKAEKDLFQQLPERDRLLVEPLIKKREGLWSDLSNALYLMYSLNRFQGVVTINQKCCSEQAILRGLTLKNTFLSSGGEEVFKRFTQTPFTFLVEIFGQDAIAECGIFFWDIGTVLFSTRSIWEKALQSPHAKRFTFSTQMPVSREWQRDEINLLRVPHVMKQFPFASLMYDRQHSVSQLYEFEELPGAIPRVIKVVPRTKRGWEESAITYTIPPCPFLVKAKTMAVDSLFIALNLPKYPTTLANIYTTSIEIFAIGFLQLLIGVDHLHQLGFIHQDIKPSNIFCDGQRRLVLGDFGLTIHNNTVLKGRSGTYTTMAPEAFEGRPCFASDIFSLGVTLYYCQHKTYLFKIDAENILKRKTFVPHTQFFPASTPDFWLHNLILKMMHGKPQHRPSLKHCAETIRQYCPNAHNYVKSLCNMEEYDAPLLRAPE